MQLDLIFVIKISVLNKEIHEVIAYNLCLEKKIKDK